MEYAFTIAGGGRIMPEHLPDLIRRPAPSADRRGPAAGSWKTTRRGRSTRSRCRTCCACLERHGGNKTTAAAELGISLKTMYNKLNRLNERKAAG